jgi:hypothetical protein
MSTCHKTPELRKRSGLTIPNRLLSHDLVDIYVGIENTHWILHEKLLCHRSKFFRKALISKTGRRNEHFGLPDEEDLPFRQFVAWLYADVVPPAKEEKDLGPLLDLYLMGEKWEINKLKLDVMNTVRTWYHETDSWPGLRRVQYIYANTAPDSPMRELMISCAARMFVLGDGLPPHWERAMRRDGAQLAVDILLSMQKWKIDESVVPDARKPPQVPIPQEDELRLEIKAENNGSSESSMSDVPDYKPSESEETAVEDNNE